MRRAPDGISRGWTGPTPENSWQAEDLMTAYNGSRRLSRVSNLAYSFRNARSTSPVGPLRCFPTMILAMPLSLVSLLYTSSR